MTETVTFRAVREWNCVVCGGYNLTAESDIAEEGCAVCGRCEAEVDKENFEEEVE